MQYLEDCGILSKVLSGDLCAHYRQFKSHVFYPWCKPLEQIDSRLEICSTCHLKEMKGHQNRLVLVGNFLAGKCAKTHDLSIFFEGNKIPFHRVDPMNSHLDPASSTFLRDNGLKQELVRVPRIWLHGTEVSIKRIYEFAAKGLFISVLRGQRCLKCFKKTTQCYCTPPRKEEASPEPVEDGAKSKSTVPVA